MKRPLGCSRISFVVGNDMLGTIVQVLQDHRVTKFSVNPEEGAPESAPTRRVKNTSESKTSETRLGSLILSILRAAKEPMTSPQIGEEIEKHDYRRQSASPCLSDLEKEGAVHCDKSIRQRYLYSMKRSQS